MHTSAPGIEFALDTLGGIPGADAGALVRSAGSTALPVVEDLLTPAEAAA